MFIDYASNFSTSVLETGYSNLREDLPFDGVSLEFNEATGSCNGECPTPRSAQNFTSELLTNYSWFTSYGQQQEISTYKLPFIPGSQVNLDNATLSLNATHKDNTTEFNLHNLFGHSHSMRVREVFTK